MAAAAARMKNAQTANIAVIGDEDTVTGFLLAGVGAMDGKKDTTYLMVDSSQFVKETMLCQLTLLSIFRNETI
jgi:vacuolar-type H+-ATPase subunit F/Vma7